MVGFQIYYINLLFNTWVTIKENSVNFTRANTAQKRFASVQAQQRSLGFAEDDPGRGIRMPHVLVVKGVNGKRSRGN